MNSAETFLNALGDEYHTFQVFSDKKGDKPHISKVISGTLKEAQSQLFGLNKLGVGIYVTINKTDGRGRKTENITKVRALFADLDGSPLAPILKAKPEPHMIIKSSKGKYHAYWLVDDCPLDKFSMYQKAIAKKFDSDPKVCDLPRVMRLPGFYHCKGNPYPTTIKYHNHHSPYFLKEIEEGLGLELKEDKKANIKSSSSTSKSTNKTSADSIKNTNIKFTDGRRNDDLFKVACAMRGRGESKEDIKLELLSLNQNCEPPLIRAEALEIVDNVWNRY
jgi:hypothetical protein